jgi:putative hydrolase of the HAD superfamily
MTDASCTQGEFGHIDTWIFDLDNTLYPAGCRLFDQIDVRMGEFISDLLSIDKVEARRIQKQFFFDYGTTMRGLMTEHQVIPEDFLSYVHDIDHSPVPENTRLSAALDRLPGRKLVFTNGTVKHAEDVMNKIGITSHFDTIFDIKAADYIPKPQMVSYEMFLARDGVNPKSSAMFEDIIRNLEPSHQLGMTTVLVHDPDNDDGAMINTLNGDDHDTPHVHHVTSDLADFLEGLGTPSGMRIPK